MTMKGFAGRLERVGPTRGFILLLSLGLIAWGVFVLNPLVVTFTTSFYSGLAAIASEPVWGLAFVVAGSTMGYGAITRKLDVISLGAMFGFLLWCCVALLYSMSNPTVTPVITNSVLALAHAWGWLCVKIWPDSIGNRTIYNDQDVEALMEARRR